MQPPIADLALSGNAQVTIMADANNRSQDPNAFLVAGGPVIPAAGVLIAVSPQHAVESESGPSDSSKVTTSSPSFLKAGELRMRGTHVLSQALAETKPPGLPLAQGESWPSSHRFGVM